MSSPRKGSMGFYPRVRAKSIRVSVKSWPLYLQEAKLLGFPAFKAYTAQAVLTDLTEKSHMYGKEVVKTCTVLECPDIYIVGLKLYSYQNGALQNLTTLYSTEIPEKVMQYYKNILKSNKTINDIDRIKDKISEVRAIAATQPYLTTIGKKVPDLLEIKIAGNVESAIEYGKSLLGKPLSVDSVFKELQLVDIIGVTKGKGFQGVIKRFGVKELPRWHKHRKGSRKVGSIGPIDPTLMRFVPRPGKMGFHRRTEYNKQILKIDGNSTLVNPKGGIKHYGLIKNKYVILSGSVMGPPKRFIFLRYPIRPLKKVKNFRFERLLI